MTIEEFKLLKDWVQTYHKDDLIPFGNGKYTAFNEIHGDKVSAIVDLIDAEIARLSVTDEQLKGDIAHLKAALRKIPPTEENEAFLYFYEQAVNRVITALQAYRKPAVLHISQTAMRECVDRLTEFLNSEIHENYDKETYDSLSSDLSALVAVAGQAYRTEPCYVSDDAFGHCGACGYEFNSELINEYEIKRCPSCGRKLTED